MKYRQNLLVLAALVALGFTFAQSAQADEPRGYGPGMMGNYGPGAYGPGMMGNFGPGGSGGYGPGMMGGYGYRHGPGMMGGYGAGMMGLGGPLNMLNLNEQQRAQINQIRDETRRKNWEVMGRLMDEQARLRDLLGADKREPAAIGKQSMKIADLRRQMLETSVDAHNRIEALLSKEQKEQMRNFRQGWMMGDGD